MVENNFGFGSDDWVYCLTREEAIAVLKIAHERGYEWANGDSYLDRINWSYNAKYNFYNGLVTSKIYISAFSAIKFINEHKTTISKPYLVW